MEIRRCRVRPIDCGHQKNKAIINTAPGNSIFGYKPVMTTNVPFGPTVRFIFPVDHIASRYQK